MDGSTRVVKQIDTFKHLDLAWQTCKLQELKFWLTNFTQIIFFFFSQRHLCYETPLVHLSKPPYKQSYPFPWMNILFTIVVVACYERNNCIHFIVYIIINQFNGEYM